MTRTKAQRGYIKQQTGLTKVGDHQPVEICGLCDGRHNHNRCYMRGEAFWDPAWAKKVRQYNVLNGSKPDPNYTLKKKYPRKAMFVEKHPSALKSSSHSQQTESQSKELQIRHMYK
jgi:hypothetical protein